MNKPSILVIGGGIIGTTAAVQLALASENVTLIDPMVDEGRASAGSLAWLNVSSTADPTYARLRHKSMRLWHRMAKMFPDCPVRFPGALHLGRDSDSIGTHQTLMDSLGWPAVVLDSTELLRRIPALANPPDSALLMSREGAAHPDRITAWMLERAGSSGVNVMKGRVSKIRTNGGAVTGVQLQDGDRIACDRIIVAAGNDTRALLTEAGVDLAIQRSPGILMHTAPVPNRFPFMMATPELDFWQDDTGVILMSMSLAKTPGRSDNLIVNDALTALTDMVPCISGIKVTRVLRRDRPIPSDGYPLVGPVGPTGLWIAAMHSGMTLAPVVAEALVDWILGRAERHDMTAYNPDRDMDGKRERVAL